MKDDEIQRIETRLKEIDSARNDFIRLIASGNIGEDSLDEEFAKLFAEEEELSGKLLSLKAQSQTKELDSRAKTEIQRIKNTKFELECFDDIIVRKVIECIKVLSKTEILIIFKGGFEVIVDVDKK